MRYISGILWVSIFWGILCGSVVAQVYIHAPKDVAQGDPFVVKIEAAAPTPQFVITWRDKHITIPSEDNQRIGLILLAVPLDAQPGAVSLTVNTPKGGVAQHQVRVIAKARPVQRLTVDSKYVDPPPDVQERVARDRQKVIAILAQYIPERAWSVPFVRPVPGDISSQFGLKRVLNGKPRSPHRGLDFRGQTGQPILALADGQVALAEDLYFSGNAVYVNHGGGVFSAYLHMSEIGVRVGQRVRRGHVLGLVGSTGVSTAPHLHLSLNVQGTPADPLSLLEAVYTHP